MNTDKTKYSYIVMSRDQNAGLRYNIKIESNSCKRVEEYKYLGTTFTYQNSISGRNQDGLELNGTHQLLVYGDNVLIFGGSIVLLKKHKLYVGCW